MAIVVRSVINLPLGALSQSPTQASFSVLVCMFRLKALLDYTRISDRVFMQPPTQVTQAYNYNHSAGLLYACMHV